MAGWIGIDSSHYDSDCATIFNTVEEALDGVSYWFHDTNETHWFILDLGQTYNVQKVRGRSNDPGYDPTDVNIYVSDDKGDWGVAVATGISSWQGTSTWQEEEITDKNGRYVKVEIVNTAHANRELAFGAVGGFKIFDVYGEAEDVAVFMGTNF